MSLPQEFQLIIPVPSSALPAPFVALEVRHNDEEVCSVEYLLTNPIGEGAVEGCPQSSLGGKIKSRLSAYLEGPKAPESLRFDLPLRPAPTDFRKAVRKAVVAIPFGETRAYGKIAGDIGNPKAAQSVGNACRNSPFAIVVPCFRAVGKNDLGGFTGNKHVAGQHNELAIKRWLLKREGVPVDWR